MAHLTLNLPDLIKQPTHAAVSGEECAHEAQHAVAFDKRHALLIMLNSPSFSSGLVL